MALPASVLAALPAERWQAETAPFLKEWRGLIKAEADAVACPQNTGEVARLVAACNKAQVALVPQGGNTGLVGGSVPYSEQLAAGLERGEFDTSAYAGIVILSLSAMANIREVDAANFTMAVDAGVVLADVQQAAAQVNRYFPLSVAAEQQCQIGGNLASNCGGINVLRYGNSRDLVLGIEAVTADGQIINQMTALRKNNMGYSLKDLLIGSEGTLAVITGAVLKLFPRPSQHVTLMFGLQSPDEAVLVLAQAREMLGDLISGCELMCQQAVDFALTYGEGCVRPFKEHPSWYLLLEFSGFEARLPEQLQAFMSLSQNHLACPAVLATHSEQRQQLWRLRKSIPAAQSAAGASIKHDVSVPVSKVPELLSRGIAAVTELMPGLRPCPFGHLGDGNLHFNLSQPESMPAADFLAQWQRFNRVLHNLVAELGGSIAAEHGIGQLKTAEFERYADGPSLALMKTLKRAMDPSNILNPGKLLIPD